MSQSNPYSYTTSLEAEQALALRLNDVANVRWSKAENNLYIAEALRFWNCLTQVWLQDWVTTYDDTALPWQSSGNSLNALVGANPTSPRFQTLNDAFVYTVAEYHLQEPPTGATWTGTDQFSIDDFSEALQRRRDQILQVTGCNIGPFSTIFSVTPGTNRVELPDSPTQSILDVRRIRFLPVGTPVIPPSTLYREDQLAFQYFASAFEQTSGIPMAWDVLAGPPLFITFDTKINVANTLDILGILSAGMISPPTASPLYIPDDWYWGLKFGMMADLLSKEAESTDLERAAYCEQRWQECLKLMVEMPWMTQASLNNVPCDTPSVAEADGYSYEWQSNPNAQQDVIRGGIDLFAVSPPIQAGGTIAVKLTLVGNAPIPQADGDFIQVSREVLDVILDEAQHLAQFKHGGAEFAQSMPLHENLIRLAMTTNKRLKKSGIFAGSLRPEVSRQEQADPRYALEGER